MCVIGIFGEEIPFGSILSEYFVSMTMSLSLLRWTVTFCFLRLHYYFSLAWFLSVNSKRWLLNRVLESFVLYYYLRENESILLWWLPWQPGTKQGDLKGFVPLFLQLLIGQTVVSISLFIFLPNTIFIPSLL